MFHDTPRRGLNVLAVISLLSILGAAYGCAHWRTQGIPLTKDGESVVLVEAGGSVPTNCRALGSVEATRGSLQREDTLDVELRNAAAERRGNLVLITSRTTLTAKGQVHECATTQIARRTAVEPATPPAAPSTALPPATPQTVSAARPQSKSRTAAPAARPIQQDVQSLDERARELFVLGREAYLAQNYQDALRYFQAAYQLSGHYELNYSIGQSADQLHRNGEALSAFEKFLQSAPDGERRDEVEARVVALRGGS